MFQVGSTKDQRLTWKWVELKLKSMKSFGKFLQIAGLVLLPVAILMELSNALGRSGVAEMLIMLVAGATAFWLGRLIEGHAD